ncbi:MAG: M28 family peptidase, partial [Planctomycetota bacterium]|nr:M28 family peptidase [Planctomycetota bacterium]
AYADLPEDQPARSILFVGFSAEESGLNGSRAFVDDPIWPLSDVSLMTNFDMIGRAIDGKVQVAGAETGVGLRAIIEAAVEDCPLEVTLPSRSPGASDHTSFLTREIPALFGITENFHDDYHTPDDTSDKINFVAGMQMTRLFADIIKSAALLPERTSWIPRSERGSRRAAGDDAPRRASIRVRFGIRPDSYDEDLTGILVGGVTEGGAAEKAGVQAGDLLVGWNENTVENVRGWMELLREHDPGDVVAITVVRDGEQVQLKARLEGRDTEG